MYQYTKNPCFNTQIKQRNNEKQHRFPLDSWSLTGESTPRDQSTTNNSPVVPPWINNFPVCSVDSSLFICRGRERERERRGIERGEKRLKKSNAEFNNPSVHNTAEITSQPRLINNSFVFFMLHSLHVYLQETYMAFFFLSLKCYYLEKG